MKRMGLDGLDIGMNRNDWSSSKRDPIMSWGKEYDEVKNKTTGETFVLYKRLEDGWAIKSGGSIVWVSFQDMAKNYTEPKDFDISNLTWKE